MAYNPFNWFRKNQKVIFAILTIIIMFVFIAQFGAGDVFSRASAYFSQGRDSGSVAVTLNGRRVTETDLARLAATRKMANDFIAITVNTEFRPTMDQLLTTKLQVDEGKDNPLFGLRDIATNLMMNRRQREDLQRQVQQMAMRGGVNPQMMQIFEFQMRQAVVRAQESAVQSLNDPNTGLVAIAARPGVSDKPENLDTLMRLGALVGFDFWTLTAQQDEFFFGGTKQIDSLLDFTIWQQQAEKLGIKLTDADLVKEIQRDAAGAELFDLNKTSLVADKRITEFVTRMSGDRRGLRAEDLVAALKEEYRVILAQSMLIGLEPGVRRWRSLVGGAVSPSVGTPDEFLKFFREWRTTLRAKLMPVKVESFVSQVKTEPSEDELRKLFEKYKDREPNPEVRTPGFKEPRRVRAEYVIGSLDAPLYRDYGAKRAVFLAEMALPYRRAKVILLAPILIQPSSGPMGAALTAYWPLVTDPVSGEYRKYLETTQTWIYPDEGFVQFGKEKSLQVASWLRPATLGQLISGSAVSANPAAAPGSPLGVLAQIYAVGTSHEQRGSIALNAARIAASSPASTFPGLHQLLTTVALTAPRVSRPTPIEELAPAILSDIQQRMSRDHLAANIAELRAELAKLKDKSDVSAEMVTKKAKEMSLTFHRMPKPVAALTIMDAAKSAGGDLGLNAFRDGLNRTQARTVNNQEVAGRLFSNPAGTYLFDANSQFASETEEMLFWRSEDLAARARRFDEARADVLQEWRLEQARSLARRKALEIQERINKEKLTPADALRLLNEMKSGEIFELDGVAQAVPPKEVRPEVRTQYQPYKIPESLEAMLPYPPADLPKLLLEAKRAGEARVFVDQPTRTFYVAVIEARDEPSVSDFKKLYERTPFRDPLYELFLAQKRRDFLKSMTEQLRREAGAKLDKEGRYELPEDIRKRFSGQDDFQG